MQREVPRGMAMTSTSKQHAFTFSDNGHIPDEIRHSMDYLAVSERPRQEHAIGPQCNTLATRACMLL